MLDLKESEISTKSKILCQEFLKQNKRKKYVLGRNIYSKAIIKNYKIDGIIDDFTEKTSFHGVPVFKSPKVPKNALVLNAAGGRPLSAKRQLDVQGLENIDYFAFLRQGAPGFPEVVFNEGFRSEFQKNKKKYYETILSLADKKSQEVFKRLVYFRYTLDIKYLSCFSEKQDSQYFEPFLNLQRSGESFIDVGGFDGDTSIKFSKRCPKYRAIHIFEPDRNNMKKCRLNLQGLKNVKFYQIGASNYEGKAKLQANNSASKIIKNGKHTIQMSCIDRHNIAHASFIKVDTEGFELQALLGMKEIISSQTPRLAICIYHRPGDFWKVPQLIKKFSTLYNVFVRHYTESIYETVMYFVPKK